MKEQSSLLQKEWRGSSRGLNDGIDRLQQTDHSPNLGAVHSRKEFSKW